MKKVCIITTSLGEGGAQRFSGLLSQMLSNLGYNVKIVSTKNIIDYEFSGALFNLEEKLEGRVSIFNKTKILRAYFKKHNFNFIIDNRPRSEFFKEFLLYYYVFKAKNIISIIHSYYLKTYLPNSKCLARVLYFKNANILAVSKEIQNAVVSTYGFKNCIHIYNPIELASITAKANEEIEVEGEYILCYGRIEERVKNFTLLLQAYKISSLSNSNIKLYIIGDGKDVDFLNFKIRELELENYVIHKSYIKNPFPFVKKARFTTLTSRHEGFPLVLIESLSLGTPVVSVNCKSGPKEIIEHEHNGLLVENNSPTELANAFDTFIKNKPLYEFCKKNAVESVGQFSMDNISKAWKKLLD
ncbi:glycosyltransferase [Algibacter mikhailovii]|uniref:Glycosyl transferase n=1 Tax=Algibacter mikhailovii TaxID=425498 RepID=A0A918R4F6_9FLAO|nr:glycosyltransferase [Algibacter mikhailovii]GGZ81631.1 glycosyl transferase [Algibacter mikhailovii]